MLDFGPSGPETVLGEGTTKPGDGLALLQGNTVDWAGTSTLILDRNIDSGSNTRKCHLVGISYNPKSRSALPCAIRSRSAVLTGSWSRNARAWTIDA